MPSSSFNVALERSELKAIVAKDRHQGKNHFAEDVVLCVQHRIIADANRPISAKSRPGIQDLLLGSDRAVHAIQRSKIQICSAAGDVQ